VTVENLCQNLTDRTFNLVKTGLEVCHAKLNLNSTQLTQTGQDRLPLTVAIVFFKEFFRGMACRGVRRRLNSHAKLNLNSYAKLS